MRPRPVGHGVTPFVDPQASIKRPIVTVTLALMAAVAQGQEVVGDKWRADTPFVMPDSGHVRYHSGNRIIATIDVLVLYDRAVRAEARHFDINHSSWYVLDEALQEAGVNVRLVGVRQLPGDVEQDLDDDGVTLDDLPGRGSVDSLRKQYGADLVMAWLGHADGWLSGRALMPVHEWQFRPEAGFSVVRGLHLSFGGHVAAHEIGHNLGLGHGDDGSIGFKPYGKAWVDYIEAYTSLMRSGTGATEGLTFYPVFSRNGEALLKGWFEVKMGDDDHRSLEAIRETAALVAGYLPSTGQPEVGEEEPEPEPDPEPEPEPEGRCSGGECVLGGFKVRVSYENDGWSWAEAHSADLGDRTAAFWFFEPDNVEVFVKILDGCRINGHHWLYATKLSGQQVSVLVDGERVAVPDEGVKDLSWRRCE